MDALIRNALLGHVILDLLWLSCLLYFRADSHFCENPVKKWKFISPIDYFHFFNFCYIFFFYSYFYFFAVKHARIRLRILSRIHIFVNIFQETRSKAEV